MSATNETSDNQDFDFAEVTGSPEEKEQPKKETAKKKITRLEKQIATSGSLTPGIIKEARELAESPKGLNIEKFMQKHRLINIDIEQLLHAPLKKNGSFV